MHWAEADGIMAEMGFTDDHSDKFTTLESNTRDMLLLDILENTNIQGVWAFRVDADTVTSPMTCKYMCTVWSSVQFNTSINVVKYKC